MVHLLKTQKNFCLLKFPEGIKWELWPGMYGFNLFQSSKTNDLSLQEAQHWTKLG